MRQRNIKGFRFASTAKFLDALGAVGEKASDDEVIAEYDRRGGLLYKIVKGEAQRMETGEYYDFAKGQAKKAKAKKVVEVKETVKKKAKKTKKK